MNGRYPTTFHQFSSLRCRLGEEHLSHLDGEDVGESSNWLTAGVCRVGVIQRWIIKVHRDSFGLIAIDHQELVALSLEAVNVIEMILIIQIAEGEGVLATEGSR